MGLFVTTLHASRPRPEGLRLGRPLFWVLAAWLTVATPAVLLGDEIHMGWDGCVLEGASELASFACDTDAGEHAVVVSFMLDPGLPGFGALSAMVSIGTQGTTSVLPEWWKTAPRECREDALRISFDFSDAPQTACSDIWSGHALTLPPMIETITTPDLPPHGSSTFARIQLSGFLDAGSTDLEAGQEYLAFKLRVRNTGTTGASCEGCCDPVAVVVDQLQLQSAGDQRVLYQLSVPAQWQAPTGCRPVPALARSWGQVRSLYR